MSWCATCRVWHPFDRSLCLLRYEQQNQQHAVFRDGLNDIRNQDAVVAAARLRGIELNP